MTEKVTRMAKRQWSGAIERIYLYPDSTDIYINIMVKKGVYSIQQNCNMNSIFFL
jgi:hypothetical protein